MPSLDDDGEDEEEESSIDLDLSLNLEASLRVSLPPDDLDLHGTRTGRERSRMGGEWERTYGHRKDVEQLQARQYWRAEWRSDVALMRAFDLGDASTLGTSSHPTATR
jgi:gamma-tubulin complex component 5